MCVYAPYRHTRIQAMSAFTSEVVKQEHQVIELQITVAAKPFVLRI